jgi:4-amino-4-deoxy-L-arabinose transferase-like glycosyltransferase
MRLRTALILSFGLFLLYLFLRLLFLEKLPIFTDEAIYVRWAQIAFRDSNWRFISLTDGKQPGLVWAAIVFMRFIDDPLLATRFVSVVFGLTTMIGLWFLSWELFRNKHVSFLTSFLYVCYPFAQVYDRMALYDSMVGSFYIWALYFSILLVRKVRLDLAYTLGIIIGGGILTKSTNFFSIYLLPVTLLLFDWKKTARSKRLARWVLFAIVAFIVSLGLYNVLRLSPFFQMVATKNATFVYPLSEWLRTGDLIGRLLGNTKGLGMWLTQYLKPTYIFLIIASWFVAKQYTKEKLVLFLYFLAPFGALIVFGRTIFPRFVFFMSLPLLVLAGVGLYAIAEKVDTLVKKNGSLFRNAVKILVVGAFVSLSLYTSIQFAYDPVNAKIADADSNQYVNSWSAGWGVKESIEFFNKESKDKKIFVATEGTFGLMPASLELYLVENKNITLRGYWPIAKEELPAEVIESAKIMPTYFVFYQPEHMPIPENYPLKLIFQKQEGKSFYYYRLYQVVSK